MKKADNQALVIFGASGDLTCRKLIPSVFDLYINNSLPEGYAVLGVSRTKLTDEEFREKMRQGITNSQTSRTWIQKKSTIFSRCSTTSASTRKRVKIMRS